MIRGQTQGVVGVGLGLGEVPGDPVEEGKMGMDGGLSGIQDLEQPISVDGLLESPLDLQSCRPGLDDCRIIR